MLHAGRPTVVTVGAGAVPIASVSAAAALLAHEPAMGSGTPAVEPRGKP
jgi:hypothetical protein